MNKFKENWIKYITLLTLIINIFLMTGDLFIWSTKTQAALNHQEKQIKSLEDRFTAIQSLLQEQLKATARIEGILEVTHRRNIP